MYDFWQNYCLTGIVMFFHLPNITLSNNNNIKDFYGTIVLKKTSYVSQVIHTIRHSPYQCVHSHEQMDG